MEGKTNKILGLIKNTEQRHKINLWLVAGLTSIISYNIGKGTVKPIWNNLITNLDKNPAFNSSVNYIKHFNPSNLVIFSSLTLAAALYNIKSKDHGAKLNILFALAVTSVFSSMREYLPIMRPFIGNISLINGIVSFFASIAFIEVAACVIKPVGKAIHDNIHTSAILAAQLAVYSTIIYYLGKAAEMGNVLTSVARVTKEVATNAASAIIDTMTNSFPLLENISRYNSNLDIFSLGSLLLLSSHYISKRFSDGEKDKPIYYATKCTKLMAQCLITYSLTACATPMFLVQLAAVVLSKVIPDQIEMFGSKLIGMNVLTISGKIAYDKILEQMPIDVPNIIPIATTGLAVGAGHYFTKKILEKGQDKQNMIGSI